MIVQKATYHPKNITALQSSVKSKEIIKETTDNFQEEPETRLNTQNPYSNLSSKTDQLNFNNLR